MAEQSTPGDTGAGETTPPETASRETTPPVARARLRATLTRRPNATTAIVTALMVAAGFTAAVQLSAPDDVLDRASRADLIQILDSLGTRADQLEEEIARLETTRADLVTGAGSSEAAQAEADDRLATLGVLAGTVPATGPGVEMVISDPDDVVSASTMLSVVQELRDAGAEAIQVSGAPDRSVRIVASTAFVDVPGGGVSVGGVALNPSLTIVAIGDPATLSTALSIPGGAVTSVETAGARVSVRENPSLVVDALHEPTTPSYAQPAPAEDADTR